MKTLVQWEVDDIKVGRFYYYNPNNDDITKNLSFFLSRLYKIGYCHEFGSYSHDPRYVSMAMTDGWVSGGMSKEQFAKQLTENNECPCTGKDLQILLQYCADCYGDTK